MSQIKVGFVGYGGSAKTYHLPYLLPVKEIQIYAFLQRAAAPSIESAPGSHCTVDFPAAKHYRTSEDFFGDPAIELVIVTTHTDTHGSFAEKAIAAGKHGQSLLFDASSGKISDENLSKLWWKSLSRERAKKPTSFLPWRTKMVWF